jgi:hypothetical protein
MKPGMQETSPPSKLEELTDDFKMYVSTIYELNKLRLVDKLSSAAANLTVYILGTILAVFTILFISVGVALWLNTYLNSSFSGFFIVAGIYLLLTLIVVLGRNNGVKKSVSDSIIKHALEN